MSNICTTVEQSKRLLELGLSKDSADMFYDRFGILRTAKPQERYEEYHQIPCWSLLALLNMFPNRYSIDKFDDGTIRIALKGVEKYIQESDLFNAVYNAIIYLLCNGHIALKK